MIIGRKKLIATAVVDYKNCLGKRLWGFSQDINK